LKRALANKGLQPKPEALPVLQFRSWLNAWPLVLIVAVHTAVAAGWEFDDHSFSGEKKAGLSGGALG